jgi:Domain of unknown function (DUF5658)
MKQSSDNAGGVCLGCGYQTATVSVSACPACGGAVVSGGRSRGRLRVGFFALPEMLFQDAYVWFVLVSVLDLMLTWIILLLGGSEVNVIADAVIKHTGAAGMVMYKLCLTMFVIVMCEVIGRRRRPAGLKLAEWSVAVSAIPVVLSLVQLYVA